MFQIIINVPEHLLGKVLAGLPPRINPQISRLMPKEERSKVYNAGSPGGKVQPEVLRLIKKESQRLADVKEKIKTHSGKTVTSAFYALAKKGLIVKANDGKYEAVA